MQEYGPPFVNFYLLEGELPVLSVYPNNRIFVKSWNRNNCSKTNLNNNAGCIEDAQSAYVSSPLFVQYKEISSYFQIAWTFELLFFKVTFQTEASTPICCFAMSQYLTISPFLFSATIERNQVTNYFPASKIL